MLKITAPAKINLTLEVLRKRPDGFHEIRSVFQTVDLCDTLYIEPGEGVVFKSDMESWSPAKSLLSKAVSLIQDLTGGKKGAAVRIEKRIPLMSGLGGDSSDTAALLKGLDEFWELQLGDDKLGEMAARLGSDVGFF